MKRIQFYMCPQCGNIITATGEAAVTCCGRKLTALVAKPAEGAHALTVEPIEDELYITFSHPMEKAHYISFVACLGYDRLLLVRLYPEQGGELRLPKLRGSKLYFGCNTHGLYVNN
ncbi:MAG: XRE family transcriptional regulator, partial [Eubacteriales bacterium]|nr:XRE family transcriptional regulator [Eubacteriales bacterium]